MGITETWFTDTSPLNLFNIDGYTFLPKNRESGRGGGVALYLKDDFDFKVRGDLSNVLVNDAESLFVEVHSLKHKNIIVGVIYRPPGQSISDFNNCLSVLLETVNDENKRCFLMGDFNIDLLKVSAGNDYEYFLNLMSLHSFNHCIDKPTRVSSSCSLLDNIFSNVFDVTVKKAGIILGDVSDHYPIFLFCDSPHTPPSPLATMKRRTSPENVSRLISELASVDWEIVMSDNSADSAYSSFLDIFRHCFDRCCPYYSVKNKLNRTKSPWLSKGILKSIQRKNKLFKKFKINPTPSNKNAYSLYRNVLTDIIRMAKKMYYYDIIESNKNNSTQLWKILNDILNKKGNVSL
ncbi:hypothetical protein HOLleu_38558 [Holothuria leucospilota]|uniref:Endonuclease/exonuclease/phosphatase domain-containing protein n=1 Tax=Holothuria leucospilota TaxID=206669 RepID=A0A9Q1BCB5_HOLLE|nr:hypothetical protein HOLleu_38558 [Holothuria leucospilota]